MWSLTGVEPEARRHPAAGGGPGDAGDRVRRGPGARPLPEPGPRGREPPAPVPAGQHDTLTGITAACPQMAALASLVRSFAALLTPDPAWISKPPRRRLPSAPQRPDRGGQHQDQDDQAANARPSRLCTPAPPDPPRMRLRTVTTEGAIGRGRPRRWVPAPPDRACTARARPRPRTSAWLAYRLPNLQSCTTPAGRPGQLLSVVLVTAGPSASSVRCVSAQLARNCRAAAVGVPGWAV
jgi:hypothetical protein